MRGRIGDLGPGERFEDGDDGFQPSQCARFAASQRREPESSQPRLNIAQVVLAEGEVVEEVLDAAAGFGTGLGDGRAKFALHGEAGFAQFFQLGEKGVDLGCSGRHASVRHT